MFIFVHLPPAPCSWVLKKNQPTTLDIEIYCHDKLCRAGKNDEIHLNTEKRHKN